MCGRYTLTKDGEALAVALGVEGLRQVHLRPRANITPTERAPVLVGAPVDPAMADPVGPLLRAVSMRWGFAAGGASVRHPLINARSETVHQKPTFRASFSHHRCLILADGFIEWTDAPRRGQPRQPWWIHPSPGELLTFAGIWTPSESEPAGERDLVGEQDPAEGSFAILTTPSRGQARRIHDRMPLCIPPHLRELWMASAEDALVLIRTLDGANVGSAALGESLAAAAPGGSLAPLPAFSLRAIDSRINRGGFEDPSLLDPIVPLEAEPSPSRPPQSHLPQQTDLFPG